MSDDVKPKGPYTLWKYYGYDGWAWEDFQTLDDAVFAEKHTSSWVIQEPVRIRVEHVKVSLPDPPDLHSMKPEDRKDG